MKEEEMKNRGIGWHEYEKSQPLRGKSYFLGIGIDKYENAHYFPPLKNAFRDVQEVGKLLDKNFEFDEVSYLVDASRDLILDNLGKFTEELTDADKLLIYYSGHGGKRNLHANSKLAFWAPANAHPEKYSTLITEGQILELLQKFPARHIFLVSDSCYSGKFFSERKENIIEVEITEENIRALEQGSSRYGLFSSGEDQTAADDFSNGHSPFAAAFMDILNETRSTYIPVKIFIHLVRSRAQEYDPHQIAVGGTFFRIGNNHGEYVFRRRKHSRQEPLGRASANEKIIELIKPLPSYVVDASLHAIIPTITIKIITIMEECLRMSCRLLLDQLEMPLHLDRWNIRKVCENKIHVVFDLLKEVDILKDDLNKYILSSDRVYQATKKIQQQISSNLAEDEFECLHPIPSNELSFFFFDTLETVQEKISVCYNLVKNPFGDDKERGSNYRISLLDASLQLQKIFLMLENIIEATDRYELPDHLRN